MTLNPHHPVTKTMRDHWHKIAALIMQKQGITKVVITPADIQALNQSMAQHIMIHDHQNGLDIQLVDAQTAVRLAAENQTKPPSHN